MTNEPKALGERQAEDERMELQTIAERDDMENRLTVLAEAVGEYFAVPVGEWSSSNDPDKVALEILGGGYKTPRWTDWSKHPTANSEGGNVQGERGDLVVLLRRWLYMVSDENGWGTYQYMEGSRLYGDASQLKADTEASLSPAKEKRPSVSGGER